MTGLIERLEAASEDDPGLYIEVAEHALLQGWINSARFTRIRRLIGAEAYLDAALTLVPEDPANLGKPMLWSIAYDEDGVGGERGYTASLGKGYHDPGYIYGHSVTTPALALYIACLRARAAQ